MQKWRKWEAAEESDWLMALKRESVLSPLATQSRPGAQRVEEAALELGLRRSVERFRPLASRSALDQYERGKLRFSPFRSTFFRPGLKYINTNEFRDLRVLS